MQVLNQGALYDKDETIKPETIREKPAKNIFLQQGRLVKTPGKSSKIKCQHCSCTVIGRVGENTLRECVQMSFVVFKESI